MVMSYQGSKTVKTESNFFTSFAVIMEVCWWFLKDKLEQLAMSAIKVFFHSVQLKGSKPEMKTVKLIITRAVLFTLQFVGITSTNLTWGQFWPGTRKAFGCDYPGNDISQSDNTQIEEYRYRCRFSKVGSLCTHFTWNPQIKVQ